MDILQRLTIHNWHPGWAALAGVGATIVYSITKVRLLYRN